ncbi:MAG: hypothetical protein IPK19_39785 [Chloroflexi bacterium]|nr:hypothetical protein [Chloroflexota bacterium]
MADSLGPIRKALEQGDQKKAVELLRPLLAKQPTADLWVLASRAAAGREKSIECLRRALALDPDHAEAQRRLKLEGGETAAEQARQVRQATHVPARTPTHPTAADLPPLKKVKKRPARGRGRRIALLVAFLLLAVSCSLLTLNMVGLVTGPIALVTTLLGGPTPIAEVGGKPLAEVDDAVMRVDPAQSRPAQARAADVLDNGYMHEYTFPASESQTMMIYIQFLSLTANRVSRNVAIVAPGGHNIAGECDRDTILEGDNNITFMCDITRSGAYAVRILGRQDESVGAYFIGVERMDLSF